jgi:opacity protein-like surface antigen
MNRKAIATLAISACAAAIAAALASCTQETQNEIGRTVRNWTGTNGVLEVYAGDKLVKRFMKIDKLTTATGTKSDEARAYRFGYGVLDSDLDGQPDPGGKQIYFEISDYSTSYVFYENPN